MPPAPKRPTSWQTFLRAHWGAIAGADFFTTEVWTWRGLVTFYTMFAIDLATRRVRVVGITPHPDEAFMRQVVRTLSMADGDLCRVLICDRDAKWSAAVRERLEEAGIRVVQTPYEAPNANAYAERFVRSMKEECLDRIIPIGEGLFRRAVSEFVAHYHRERNHQGLENAPIDGLPRSGVGRVHRQSRLGGLLKLLPARSVTNRSSLRLSNGTERVRIALGAPRRATIGVSVGATLTLSENAVHYRPTLVGVTFEPWRPGLPIRQGSVFVTNWHLDLRQTLGVQCLVFRDDIVDVEQIRRQRVDLIGR